MKKLIALSVILVLLFMAFSSLAAGTELSIDGLSLDKGSYNTGETATIEWALNVPYEGVTTASASFDIDGLSDVKITALRILECDDTSCIMHQNADFLSYSGGNVTLGPGYSGNVTFSAKVENAEKISVKCTLKTNLGSTSKSCNATVADYSAPTPTSTPTPTATPTQKPTPTPTQKPTATPTQRPTATPSATPTQQPTVTPTMQPASTPTPTATADATQTPDTAETVIPTETPELTPEATPAQTPEETQAPSAIETATPTANAEITVEDGPQSSKPVIWIIVGVVCIVIGVCVVVFLRKRGSRD